MFSFQTDEPAEGRIGEAAFSGFYVTRELIFEGWISRDGDREIVPAVDMFELQFAFEALSVMLVPSHGVSGVCIEDCDFSVSGD